MDRSFLSGDQLIKASRDFVCIRTATYEDKEEAAFLKKTFASRPGATLRNFGFCILSPDGRQKLRRSDRGPNFVYANSAAMAADLRKRDGDLAVVFVTGHIDEAAERVLTSIGRATMLRKPFTISSLEKSIEHAIELVGGLKDRERGARKKADTRFSA